MRRVLFVLASAMLIVAAGSAVAGADGRSDPKTSVARHDITPQGEVMAAGDQGTPANVSPDTRVLGLRWSGDPGASFTVETRDGNGTWHTAQNVAKPDGGADPGSPDARRATTTLQSANVSDPVSVGHANRVRVRVEHGSVRDVKLVSVSTSSGLAGSTPGGLGGGSLPPALALSGVAVGALAFPRKRMLSVLVIIAVGASGALFALDVVHPNDAGAASQPRIVTRAEWGADESARIRACPDGPGYAIPRIAVVHHTAGANGYSQADSPAIVRGLYAYSINVRGYCDHLYNFLIDRFGTIYEGRYGGIDKGVIGAHATNFNTGTFGVVLMGDYTSLTPSGASIDSLVSLLAWKMSIHRMNPYQPVPRLGTFVNPIIGHRDAGAVSGDGTSCPGQAAYSLLPSVRARVNPQVDYGTPIGNLESVTKMPGSLSVSGWAIDPETTAPISVHAYVDGVWSGAFTASASRPDVADTYWWLGAGHGFSFSLPAGSGIHTVCVYAINVGTGVTNPNLGCITPPVIPIGNVESIQRRPDTARLTGWAVDPDTADPIALHAYVDGTFAGAFVADVNRPDVGAKFPGFGSTHGFDITVPVPAGNHQVCVYGINVGQNAPNSLIGNCQFVIGTPKGNLESVVRSPGAAQLKGWALDPDSADPVAVHVYVDGGFGGVLTADVDRPDIGAAFPGYGNAHGFDGSVPIAPGDHQLCAYAIDFAPFHTNPLLGCRTVTSSPLGNLDSVVRNGNTLTVMGWAFDPDTANPITVHLYVDGGFAGMVTASDNRADIAAAFPGYGANHGFGATISPNAGPHQVCAYGINVGPAKANPLLGCRNV
ncbi:MAG: N-acetylmuramoyl-L-alanine amidase [Acidimicrobiia bacterium]